jgi:ATP-dependent phosphoenolpyruvate carboxykinase
MSMPPTLEVRSYQSMYAFGNHIHVASVEKGLTTYDNGVSATFEQTFVSKLNTTTKCGCNSLVLIH